MKNQRKTLLMILMIMLPLAAPAGAAQENKEKIPVLINFKDKTDTELIKAHGGNVKHEYNIIPAVAAELPPQAIDALSKNPQIAFIEPDGQAQILADQIPWGIARIDATGAQSIGITGSGIRVAVLDTGIDYNHPDLKANYLGGYDFVNADNDPMDDHSHGTHVAGTVAALSNGIGVLGAAPQAGLYAVKVADSSGSCSYSNIIAGINWAVNNNANVITMSLGGTSSSSTLQNACNNAYSKGVVLVGAAGNSGGSVIYPAAYDSVIAVSATDSTNTKTSWSCYGPQVEFAAPGASIRSTLPGGLYGSMSGTSMATPHVTGAVALLMSTDVAGTVYDTNKNGKWDPAEVRSRLQSTATDLGATGRDNYYGYGLVNAYAAVSGLNSAPADPTEPVVTPPEPSPTPEETETEPVVTPPEPSTPVVMYVGELSLEQQSKVSGKNTFGWAVATVKAVDADGKAVAGANVAGSWSGLTKASVSGTTDANGVVVFTSAQVKNPRGTLTFTVTGITCDGYTYDPTQNVCSSKSVMF
ncbi:MAG: S8 family serine peptidase [Methanomethylovorans sp.]|jgi:subtilisin|nr:S8 family serine peptidase [Methanomethylovorans sp.]